MMSNNDRQKQNTWKNILLVIGATVFAFLLAETVVRILNLSTHGFDDKKEVIYANLAGPGYCYPTNPRGYFPLDLKAEIGFNKLTQLGVTEAEAKRVSEITLIVWFRIAT